MNLILLIKQQLNVTFGISAVKWYAKKDKKKFLGGAAIAVIILLSLLPMYIFLYLNLIRMIYEGGLEIGQPQLVLTLGFVVVSMMVLFFGIGFVMSTFYFSRDLPQLIPLPFKPGEIIGAKFFTVLVQEYLTVIPILLPILIIYGRGEGAGLYYWLAGLTILIIIPLIPLGIVSAAMLVMMRVTNLGRRKDFLRIVGMFAVMALVFGFNFYMGRFPEMTEDEILTMLFSEDGLITQISRIFPPVLFATRALAAQGITALTNLLGFVALSGLAIYATLFLGDRLFYRGLIGGEEVSASKKITTDQLEQKLVRTGSPVKAIAMREIKTLFRTPIYMFNSVSMLVILPVALIIPALSGQGLEPIVELIQGADARFYVNLVGAAVIGLMAIFTPAASSSYSREGKMFWISQVIPVPPRQQVLGKMLYSYIVALLTVPVLVLFSVLVIKWTLPELIVVIMLGICISFPIISGSLLADLWRPKLNWDNPQQAIKQNLNVMLGMAVGVAIFFLLYRLVFALTERDASQITIYIAIAVASLLLGAIPYILMMRIANKRYRDIVVP